MPSQRGWLPRILLGGLAAAGIALASLPALAAEELTIGYLKHDIHEANVAIMENWAAANGVKLVKVPMGYDEFEERATAALTASGEQFDILWHNDDWGQLWEQWVEPVGDVAGMDKVAKHPLKAFRNEKDEVTAVPMVHTVGTFFYRTDLVPQKEVPRTFEDLVAVSKKLQDKGQVKWGYVGGMKMDHTWFSLWWTMWSNQCDIFKPIYERDSAVLEKNGWTPAIAEPCHQEIVEFWWDAMNLHKISPKEMTSYGREEADAVFMAGDAAFTLVDSTRLGMFNDPQTSKVAGKVGIARFPVGPRRNTPIAWNEVWGWAIPKSVPTERKLLAKQMLGAMLTDISGQIAQWEATGGPPPNREAWEALAAKDPAFKQLQHAVLAIEPPMHAAYYFPNWPAVHKAYSETALKALSGAREDIPKVLQEGVAAIHDAAVK